MNKYVDMDFQEFQGKTLNLTLPNHQVRVTLNPQEKLSIEFAELSKGKLNQSYIAYVKLQDIKRQSLKNNVQTVIQTPTEFFFLLQENVKEKNPLLDKMIHITSQKEIKLTLDIKLDFKTGTKKKSVTYMFKTVKKMDKFPDSLNNHTLTTKVEQLEEENNVVKRELKEIKSLLQFQTNQPLYLLQNFQMMAHSTIFLHGNSALSLSRDINYLILKDHIDPLEIMNLKFRVVTNCLIYFCIFKYKDLEADSANEEFKCSDFQTWIHFTGGEIVTVQLNEYKYSVIVEKNEIQEVSLEQKDEEQNKPNFSYSKNRATTEFKKLISFSHLHFGLGLEFGGKIEMVRLDFKKE